jgi:hypothetical protein
MPGVCRIIANSQTDNPQGFKMAEPVKYGATWGGTDPLTGKKYAWNDGHFYDSPIAPLPNPTKPTMFKISRGFAQYADKDLDTRASHVVTETTANAASLPGLTTSVTALGTAQVTFHTSIAASTDGGKALKLDKNAKREIVIGILRQIATVIEAIPNITQATAALSGLPTYVPGGHHTATTPDAPVILGINNTGHCQLGFDLQGSNTKRGYELQYTVGTGTAVHAGFFSNTRNVVVPNLLAGTTYTFQARALGGNNQNSDWSAPVSCMCT